MMQTTETHPLVFRMNWFWKGFFYLLIPSSMALTGWGAYQVSTIGGHLFLGVLFGGLDLFFVYLMLALAKNRIEIDATEIRYAEIFRTKTLPLNAIAGYRILPTQYVKTLVLEPREPRLKKMKIGLVLERKAELLDWLKQNLTDLDQAEYQQGLVEIYQNANLQGSPEEKAAKYQQAKRWCKTLSLISTGAGFWAILFPRPYPAAIGTLLLLPFLGMFLLRRFEGIAQFNAKKKGARPGVDVALIMPAAALILRALFDWHVLEWPAFWIPCAAFALGLFGFAVLLVREVRQKVGNILLMAVFAAIYGAGATLDLNGVLADGKVTVYHAKVVGKHFTGGKTTTYYLTLTPWRNRPEEDATVTRAVYTRYEAGNTAEILVRTGKFGIPFYFVR